MAGAKLIGTRAVKAAIRKKMLALEMAGVREIVRVSNLTTRAFFMRTPVWSGETVVNYRWSTNKGSKTQRGAIGTGNPGPTNSMSMGQEPRRGANESLVLGDLHSLTNSMKRLKTIHFTNSLNATKWNLIDDGNAPRPGMGRNPGGVVQIAMQMTRSRLGQNWK